MTNPGRPRGCHLRSFVQGPESLIIASGALRLDNCERVKNRIFDSIGSDCQALFLHILHLQELDSAGLGSLVGLHITCKNRGVQFRILSPNANQARLFEYTKLTSILSIASGIEAETIRDRLERSGEEKPAVEIGV